MDDERLSDKFLRTLQFEPEWKSLVSSLITSQMTSKQEDMTPDEIYAHLRSHEESIKQHHAKQAKKTKSLALAAQPHHSSRSSSSRNVNLNRHSSTSQADLPKNVSELSTLFTGMLMYEQDFNKERSAKNERTLCFGCRKEGHTIHNCFKLFPNLKNEDDAPKSKPKFRKDGYKGKREVKAMSAWCIDSEESASEASDSEKEDEGENLALMAMVDDEEIDYIKEMEDEIAAKEIDDEVTLNSLRNLARFKEDKKQARLARASSSSIPSSKSEVKAKPISSFNDMSSDDDSENEVQSTPIDYFKDIPSDSDSDDDEELSLDQQRELDQKRELDLKRELEENIYQHYSNQDAINEIHRLNDLVKKSDQNVLEFKRVIFDRNVQIDKLRSEILELKSKVNTLEQDKIDTQEKVTTSLEKLEKERLDLEIKLSKCHSDIMVNVHKGQKPNDKSGLGYTKNQSSLPPKNPTNPKSKEKQPQNSKVKTNKNDQVRKPRRKTNRKNQNGNQKGCDNHNWQNAVFYQALDCLCL